ncbi:hypothetical protein PMPD1_1597 [Paramixta manurensis]|uniref:Uncharacterized protein n=1 Tax=Paramixta manurensis TaxID=2740817 RepID=A0A6M8U778_9GAMM|nr:hypothetical protein PMPD1_1597 [Erwiniaceae bacterium PD-1]
MLNREALSLSMDDKQMNNSAYMRARFKTDRAIAQALEKGIKGTINGAGNTFDNIYHGLERASWYSSCFFERYQDICREIGREDVRMVKAIVEVFNRKDVVFDMFLLYVEYVLGLPQEGQHKVVGNVTRGVSGIVVEGVTGIATKKALAYSIARTISESFNLSHRIKNQIYNGSRYILTAIGFYGRNQKAALAARRLKRVHPTYYHALYRNNLEMLYIYIEPIIVELIYVLQKKENITEEQLINFIENLRK